MTGPRRTPALAWRYSTPLGNKLRKLLVGDAERCSLVRRITRWCGSKERQASTGERTGRRRRCHGIGPGHTRDHSSLTGPQFWQRNPKAKRAEPPLSHQACRRPPLTSPGSCQAGSAPGTAALLPSLGQAGSSPGSGGLWGPTSPESRARGAFPPKWRDRRGNGRREGRGPSKEPAFLAGRPEPAPCTSPFWRARGQPASNPGNCCHKQPGNVGQQSMEELLLRGERGRRHCAPGTLLRHRPPGPPGWQPQVPWRFRLGAGRGDRGTKQTSRKWEGGGVHRRPQGCRRSSQTVGWERRRRCPSSPFGWGVVYAFHFVRMKL